VGVDAQNATNALYNILGDDRLFDRLCELADSDPEADARDIIIGWLKENIPTVYQELMNEIGDEDTPAEPNEQPEVDEGNTYGSGDGGMDGQVNEEDEQDDDGGFEAIQSAIIRRIAHSHHELLMKLGPDGVLEAARDIAEFAAPVEEIGSSDVSGWVAQIERDAGIENKEVTEERDIDDDEQVCVYCGEPRDDKLGCCDENHWETKKEFDKNMNEEKDKVTYDPKTGKLSGWEHEGDWKKQTKKKDPIGKIHHMSDVARRRTEKMSKDETLEEAFERALGEEGNVELEVKKQANLVKKEIGYPNYKAFDGHDVRYISDKTGVTPEQVCKILHILVPAGLNVDETFERLVNEGAINVGDMIRDKTQPEIQGKVVGDMEENYTIQVEDDIYHIKKLNAEKIDKELTEDQVTDKLQSFVGQTFYVPAEGEKGTVSQVADQNRFSNSLVVDLANGTTTVVHFKDLKPLEETPGAIKQLWQKLVATITGGATPKMQPKINAPVSDINTPKEFQKLAGIK
jgi:hypothetical protein